MSFIASLFAMPKGMAKPPAPPPIVTRDDAAALAAQNDELAKRQGASADLLTGVRGAEALANQTGKLVLGN
jgi:hypothetical protein